MDPAAVCPDCKHEYERNGEKHVRHVQLKLIESNYIGCGDITYCPECRKGYCVSYKVDEVTPDPRLGYAALDPQTYYLQGTY